eukprot:TRINITY_DN4897_c0_g1_i1.p1 TRINITY_DN4897_c0_g1~~TRINITY_DN4897_c0_g1_i1.p1  ORF type:complete len:464 (+),score=93.95 TRINITY_DN4897_c0_g1_i1:40-1392(+)
MKSFSPFHRLLSTVFFLILFTTLSTALMQHLKIRNDPRTKFFVDNFGFEAGGLLNLTMTNFALDPPKDFASLKAGFIVEKAQTDATRFIDEADDDMPCFFQDLQASEQETYDHHLHEFRITKPNGHFVHHIQDGLQGFYNIFFVSCEAGHHVSFDLYIDLHNVGYDGSVSYLSAGDAPLATVYGTLFVLYIAILVLWIVQLRKAEKGVFMVHHLMTALVVLKCLSILFKAIELHYLRIYGLAGGWATIYYIFAFLKGIMMFVVIALVGTGFTFVKPFLSEKDKKIFMIVIPLQVLDNIAMIVVEETLPGSQGWFTWKDIFTFVDIICCGAIILPIVWSIKHLKEAAQVDGKAAKSMQKLTLFRQFYLIVVSYVYFTRIIVYLLDASLPFRWLWLGVVFTEAATLAFFVVVGYQFRPVADNPFLALDDEATSEDPGSLLGDVELQEKASGN